MEMPTEDTRPEDYLKKSAYTIGRVAAVKKTKGLEAGLLDPHTKLKAALRDLEDKQEEEQRKLAVHDARDEDCDEDVEHFELDLLGFVKKERSDPKYRRYFEGGLREVTTAEPRKDEPAKVGQILKAMAEDAAHPELGPLVAVHSPKLTASRGMVVESDKDLSSTETDLAFLEDKTIPALMAAWRSEYKKLEGALTGVYSTNPGKVDRFFKPFRKRAKKKADAPPAAAPESPPGAPTTP